MQPSKPSSQFASQQVNQKIYQIPNLVNLAGSSLQVYVSCYTILSYIIIYYPTLSYKLLSDVLNWAAGLLTGLAGSLAEWFAGMLACHVAGVLACWLAGLSCWLAG